MKNVEAVAAILKMEGVEWLACFPSNKLIEAASNAGIRPVVFRQERGGVHAACGYSLMKSGSSFGVFAMQRGPGTENAFGGVAQAWADGVPILLLPEGEGLDRTGVPPTFAAPLSYRNITKSAETILVPEAIPDALRRAFQALRSGRPGPVLVECTSALMSEEYPGDIEADYVPPKPARPRPSRSDVKDAVAALLKAKRPVIWAGQGVLSAQATAELREFAELTQIPVITTMPGKSAIDETHPLALGAANRTTTRPVWNWLQESDVLFAVGASLTRTVFAPVIPPGKFIIQATVHPGDLSKDVPVDIPMLADAKLVLEDVIEEVKAVLGEDGRRADTAVQDEIAAVRQAWMQEWIGLLTSNEVPINPHRIFYEMDRTLDRDNSVVTHDAGNPRDQMMPFYRATTPHSYIGWGKSTHLGYGLGLAIGAKVALPDRMCVNVMGDAAFGMAGLDIETTVRCGIPITTVLINNGTMAGYDKAYPESLVRHGVGMMTGDYAKIAEGLGATGIRVEKPNAIAPALRKAQQLNSEGKTVLLEVITRPDTHFSHLTPVF